MHPFYDFNNERVFDRLQNNVSPVKHSAFFGINSINENNSFSGTRFNRIKKLKTSYYSANYSILHIDEFV